MKNKGFAASSSGGGCEWYTKDFIYQGKDAFLAITDNGGMDLPASIDEIVIAGVYDMETEEVIEEPKSYESLTTALEAFGL
jgi:hypothetical protein